MKLAPESSIIAEIHQLWRDYFDRFDRNRPPQSDPPASSARGSCAAPAAATDERSRIVTRIVTDCHQEMS